MRPFASYLKIGGAILVIALLAGYGLFQARNLIKGPAVTIKSPVDGLTVHSPLVTVEGTARNVSAISLNDRPISIDERGNFSEALSVPVGYTVFTIRASDRFGSETDAQVRIVYQP